MATAEDQEELLLCCRYGELDEVQQYTDKFGTGSLDDVKDENGNTVLHMICANGHEDLLDYALSIISPSLLSARNDAGSTPLHWASLNSHLQIVKKLVLFPRGPGTALIDIKNAVGRSPLGEAEFSGWEEGAQWLVEHMRLDDQHNLGPEEGAAEELEGGDIEVEIQDAEGGVSKMNLGHSAMEHRGHIALRADSGLGPNGAEYLIRYLREPLDPRWIPVGRRGGYMWVTGRGYGVS